MAMRAATLHHAVWHVAVHHLLRAHASTLMHHVVLHVVMHHHRLRISIHVGALRAFTAGAWVRLRHVFASVATMLTVLRLS